MSGPLPPPPSFNINRYCNPVITVDSDNYKYIIIQQTSVLAGQTEWWEYVSKTKDPIILTIVSHHIILKVYLDHRNMYWHLYIEYFEGVKTKLKPSL